MVKHPTRRRMPKSSTTVAIFKNFLFNLFFFFFFKDGTTISKRIMDAFMEPCAELVQKGFCIPVYYAKKKKTIGFESCSTRIEESIDMADMGGVCSRQSVRKMHYLYRECLACQIFRILLLQPMLILAYLFIYIYTLIM